MIKVKYLIFTASAGNGHNSTARRIRDTLAERNPSDEIKIVDAYKEYTSRFNEWIINGAYKFVCNYFVWLYNVVFKRKEKIDYRANNRDGKLMQGYCVVGGMLKEIYEFKPDVIVSTYEFCAVALSNLRRVYEIPAKIYTMTLDYGISPYWERCSYGVDGVFLTDEKMVEQFINRGFAKEKLVVTGIPVAKEFSIQKEKKESRLKIGLEEDKFTVLIAKASFFAMSDRKLAEQISQFDTNIQTVIINGDEHKRKKMQRFLKKKDLVNRITNLGFRKDIAEFFSAADLIVCKGGGLTLTECVNAGIPSLIVKRLPLQEQYNSKALVDSGCALPIGSKGLAETVNNLARDEKKYSAMCEATKKIRRENAIEDICKKLESCTCADYTGLDITVSSKEIEKKVKRAAKNAVKAYKKIRRCSI